jgi:hypothetical protein
MNPNLNTNIVPSANAPGTNTQSDSNNDDIVKPYFSSLLYDFAESLAADYDSVSKAAIDDDLSKKRITYHRTTESIRNQVAWISYHLSLLHRYIYDGSNQSRKEASDGSDRFRREFKIGILSSDILPETGEFMALAIIDGILKYGKKNGTEEGDQQHWIKPSQIVILGRRDNLVKSLPPKAKGVKVIWDWEDDKEIVPSLSILIVTCSSMHITLVQEHLQGHDVSKTLLVPAVSGVTFERFCSLVKANLALSPFWNFESNPDDRKVSQNVSSGALSKEGNL